MATAQTSTETKTKKVAKVYPLEDYLKGVPESYIEKVRGQFRKGTETASITLPNKGPDPIQIKKSEYDARQTVCDVKDGVPDMTSTRILITSGKQVFSLTPDEMTLVTVKYEYKFEMLLHSGSPRREVVISSDGSFRSGCQTGKTLNDAAIKTLITREIDNVGVPGRVKYHDCNCPMCKIKGFVVGRKSTWGYDNTTRWDQEEGYELYVQYAILKPLILEKIEEMKARTL